MFITTRLRRVHFCSSFGHLPARISSELFIRRSPPRLFTVAARTGLRPAPESRSRGAAPHLLSSFTLRRQFMANSLRASAAHSRRERPADAARAAFAACGFGTDEWVTPFLNLMRMNWNTADIRGKWPVTLSFTRRVGGILAVGGKARSGQVYKGRASGFQGAEPTGLPPHSTHWCRHGLAEPEPPRGSPRDLRGFGSCERQVRRREPTEPEYVNPFHREVPKP
jgi:hypothetical protein